MGQLNLNQLRAFVTVADKGSFSASAKVLGVSQPAVTLQIQALEDFLGVELLDRQTRKVRLTDPGSVFYPVARQVLSRLETAQQQLEELSQQVKGRLVVGGSTIPGQHILPRILGLFKAEYPDVSLTLEVADTKAIVDMITDRELDVGLIGAPAKREHLISRELTADELVLLVPADHPLARKRKVPLSSLSQHDFILREAGSGTRQATQEFLRRHGLSIDRLRVSMELGSSEAVVSAVEAGLGVSIISKWAAEKSLALGRVKVAKVEGLPLVRPLYLVYQEHPRGKVAKVFVDFTLGLDMSKVKPI